MQRRLRTTLLLSLVVAAAPGLESPAAALSCAIGPGEPPDPYENHPLVFEGVALSGPSAPRFGLGSPARMLVLRWIRGTGPRVVRVKTAADLGVGPFYGHMPGYFSPLPGTTARIFAGRARGSVIRPNPCVFGDERPGPRSPLRTVPAATTRIAAGEHAWTARAVRGPRGLHCVLTHPAGGRVQRECERRRALMAVHHEDARGRRVSSTAVTVAGPGIAEARLTTPDGTTVLRRTTPLRPLLAVLDGRVDPSEVRARLTMIDGTVQYLQAVGYPTLPAPDPEGGRAWYSMIERQRDGACVGVHRVAPRHEAPPEEALAVEDSALCRRFGRKRFFHAVSAARPYHEPGAPVIPVPQRTVVFGAAAPPIKAILVRDPGGVRRLTPGRGGQFVAIYPASVSRDDITVTAQH